MMKQNVVNENEWVRKRLELMAKEKEYTRLRDELTAARQSLPWREVTKEYQFKDRDDSVSLGDLFNDHSQLIVYHFMFDTGWEEGCKSCSLLADHYDPILVHLAARDVNLVTVSYADIDTIEAYKKRMNWRFRWVSSNETEFNRDFGVRFSEEEIESNRCRYNFRDDNTFPMTEAPGISVFAKSDKRIYHTYSAYARGLESFLGVYSLLDIVPKGRDEKALSYPMEWIRHKDRYTQSQ